MQATSTSIIKFDEVQALARAHGFAHAGLGSVDLADAEPGLLAWLEAQHHGTMDYMARHGLKRARPAELVPGTASVLMLAHRYRPNDPGWTEQAWRTIDETERAYISRYALGRDYHKVVRSAAQRLAEALQTSFMQAGWPASQYRVFCDSAPVMEVELAKQAGLGWRGKHTLLLQREEGSMFFLASLFLALPAEAFSDVPASVAGHCGTCERCIAVCPTQAIVAPYKLDARRCISYLTIEHHGAIDIEFRAAMGNRIYGCDDCQLVCPWNKFAQAASSMDYEPRHQLNQVGLLELWSWSESEFLSRFEGSAIRRIGYQRWRRNIAVALGNALRAAKPETPARQALIAALNDALPGASELVAEHIQWALEQGS